MTIYFAKISMRFILAHISLEVLLTLCHACNCYCTEASFVSKKWEYSMAVIAQEMLVLRENPHVHTNTLTNIHSYTYTKLLSTENIWSFRKKTNVTTSFMLFTIWMPRKLWKHCSLTLVYSSTVFIFSCFLGYMGKGYRTIMVDCLYKK